MTTKKRTLGAGGRTKAMELKNHDLIVRNRRTIVKFDLERMGEILGDIFGGLVLAGMLFALPVIVLLLAGGY